ncbi:MAG: hypothetical protein RQ824_08625 [bacterium]|nr:hypothetical protein [bacterium]
MKIAPFINIKAIFIGFVSDFVASAVFGIALSFFMAVVLAMKGYKDAELEKSLITLLDGTTYRILSIIVGLGFTMMGGYLAGRIARSGEYFHSGAVGLLNVIFGLFFIGMYTTWYSVTAFLLVLPAAVIGGDMARKRRLSEDNKTTLPSDIE